MLRFKPILLGKILVGFGLIFIVSLTLFAQGSDSEEIINLPRLYKGPGKYSVSDIAKTNLAKQKAITQKLSKMVLDNYQSKGMNTIFRTPHFSPRDYAPNGLSPGNGYSDNFVLMYFYCTYKNKKD